MSNPYTANRIVGALPPPPGVTPNFVNPPNHDANTIALHTVCLTLITFFVGMRVGVRAFVLRQVGWDDGFILGAWALSVAFSGCMLKAMTLGVGRHLWDIPKSQWLYITAIETRPIWLLVKLAFFWSYKRIFYPSRVMKWLCYGGAFVCTDLYISQIFHDIFICIPVQKDWDPRLSGHCLPSGVGGSVTGIFNVISDVYILVLPLPFLWKLQMKLGPKLKLMALFGVGAFVNAASITRLALTYILADDKDVSWKTFKLTLFIVLELNLGLICVCALVLPAFWERVVFTQWIRLRSKPYSSFGSQEYSGGHNASTSKPDPEWGSTLLDTQEKQSSAATVASSRTEPDSI
ncbi:hypothetical protein EV356DRAFT_532274 [Viridothelium virens]|uniref:Rhodopsin domain-containing protein n=1 Tax=Viridothelium virens TaxID=1048519 RepID=A0A6A6HAD2_VIRVR|nr:hypothetical protein EV356DRAFT_532274 [Viridothelium virens]